MRSFKLFALFMFIGIAAVGLTTESANAAQVPAYAYYGYEKYKTKAHFRAFASTSPYKQYGVTAYYYRSSTVEEAIDGAINECIGTVLGGAYTATADDCKVHSIGNIYVYGMTDEELEKAKKLYKFKRNATNDDLAGFVPEESLSSHVEQGDAEAQYTLGHNYQIGIGLPKDIFEARRHFLIAAENGHSEAQYQIGYFYDTGQSVGEDLDQALSWYRKAAAQANPRAQYRIGFFYEQGRAVRKDLDEALHWYRKAAAQGHEIAGMALGRMQTAQPAPTQQPYSAALIEQETAFWESIEDSSDPLMFEAYLRRYPRGAFADIARLKRDAFASPEPERKAQQEPLAELPAAPPPLPVIVVDKAEVEQDKYLKSVIKKYFNKWKFLPTRTVGQTAMEMVGIEDLSVKSISGTMFIADIKFRWTTNFGSGIESATAEIEKTADSYKVISFDRNL